MGQAILDLPDPTQLSGSPVGPLSPQALASADDLLSQLAGDDIDRLLAEADAEKVQAAAPEAVLAVINQANVEPANISAPIPAAALTVETQAAEPAIVDVLKPVDAATEAAIDALLAPEIEETLKAVDAELAEAAPKLESLEPAHAETALATAPIIEPEKSATATQNEAALSDAAATVSAIMDPPPAPEVEPETVAAVADAAERQALSEPLILPTTTPAHPSRVSLLVKLLQLINYPVLLLSDGVREAIGKVAILTTFNAVAVIVYVMVFRRPHH